MRGSPADMAERRLHELCTPSSSAPKGVQKALKIPQTYSESQRAVGPGTFLLGGVGACGRGQGPWEDMGWSPAMPEGFLEQAWRGRHR